MKTKGNRIGRVLLIAVAAFAVASASWAGYYYEAVSVTKNQKGRTMDEMVVKSWVDGPKARVEFDSKQKEGPFGSGSYWVTTDGGETIYWVNPKDRTYSRFDLEEMMAAVGQMMQMFEQMGGMMKMEFTDVSHEKVSEGPGGSILGYPTTRYEFESGYTMEIKVMGFGQKTRVDMESTVWSTDALDASGFGVWLRPDRTLKTGFDDLDEMIDSHAQAMKGFPLKSEVVSRMTNKKGKTQTTMSTTEVKTMREQSVADQSFTVPAGYQEVEMIPNMPQQAQGQQGEQEKKGGLSGLFGRKKKDDG
ncbi:MAG: hypothetical protein R3244_11735 [Thermoanaerobaculia bacterium]|nr:hypothetical protein [Thermoanaerobaculia bacterium]